MKMLKTFEPHAIFHSIIFCILIHFNIIETHVHGKAVTRLRQEKCRSEQICACKMFDNRAVCFAPLLFPGNKVIFSHVETHFIIRQYIKLQEIQMQLKNGAEKYTHAKPFNQDGLII